MNVHSFLAIAFVALASACVGHSTQESAQKLSPVVKAAQKPARVIEESMHHLGDSEVDWPEVPKKPTPGPLVVRFKAEQNASPFCIAVKQRHVDDPWWIEINGKRVGKLRRKAALVDEYYELPKASLRDGVNVLRFVPTKKTDDISIGRVRLYAMGFRELFDLRPVLVRVRDDNGKGIPARITVTGAEDALVPIYHGASATSAVRDGIVYTSSGEARFEVSAGRYAIHVTRGPEWSLAKGTIHAHDRAGNEIDLSIRHEVDTRGWVGCDSHVHTLTYSGHGDASVQERLVTLAAEGVELAISTDHNHNTDYEPEQKKLGLMHHFKSVVGNEVTTPMGHFNAFPLDPEDKVPEHRLSNWIKVIEGIRAKGAKVVMLNHPRWPSLKDGPFGRFRLNRLSGERVTGPSKLTFDTMELVNSGTLTDDPLYIFEDWFALLNHGERIVAAGTSDSHTVGNIVGQGRSYLASKTDVPAEIDVDEACAAFLEGRCSVSLGIFCDLRVDGRYAMGDTVPVRKRGVDVAFRVASSSWIRPKLARVFLNGKLVASRELGPITGWPFDEVLRFEIDAPSHDSWLVCIVTGPGVSGAYWRTEKPYVLAASNPVWLDADHDGKYTSPRAQAEQLLAKHGSDPKKLGPALRNCDDALCVQVLAALRDTFSRNVAKQELERFISKLSPKRAVYARYLATLR